MIDEISMVPSRLFRNIDSRLREIFSSDKPFGGKSVLLCGDLYQLPPIYRDPIYKADCSSMQSIVGFELWRSFQMAELTEVMRQRDDIDFVDLLNQVRLGELDEEKEELLKSRFITKDSPDYPANITHIYAENKPVDLYNLQMLEKLPTEKHLFCTR
ncbi:uncharacterized protein [Clytia hemisphaerica]|uniref:uncharacterized protein n=1 Tax=Clytia hemisphaerica TaxID=252671 RepID=UPI0034D57F99